MAVVITADQYAIHQAGLATICPVLDMVSFQKNPVRAARERAHRIPLVQRALEPSPDRTPLPPNQQRRPVVVLDDLDHAGIAAEPAHGFCSHKRFADLADLEWIHGCACAKITLRNHECDVNRRAIGSVPSKIALRKRNESIRPVERSPCCILPLTQHAHRTLRRRPVGGFRHTQWCGEGTRVWQIGRRRFRGIGRQDSRGTQPRADQRRGGRERG
jgi:hypothetical protein